MCGVCGVQGGTTVLHVAVKGGSKEVVELLLGAGADAKAVTMVACCCAWVGVWLCLGEYWDECCGALAGYARVWC